MDNRINAIRKEIRVLRSRMLEAEAAMRSDPFYPRYSER